MPLVSSSIRPGAAVAVAAMTARSAAATAARRSARRRSLTVLKSPAVARRTRDGVGMLDRQVVDLRDHRQALLQVVGVDRHHAPTAATRGRARTRCRRARRRRRARSPRASSAAITPMRRSRCSTCASASSFSMSWRAISRSTASPVTRNSPAPTRSTLERAAAPPGGRPGTRRPRPRRPPRASTRLGGRDAPQQLARELVEALARGARRDEHRHVLPQPRAPRSARPPSACSGATRSALESASTRGSAASRGSCSRQLALDHARGWPRGRSRRAARGRARGRAAACARRGRGSRGRARRRRWRPRSARGCRRRRAGGRRPRACRAPARAS